MKINYLKFYKFKKSLDKVKRNIMKMLMFIKIFQKNIIIWIIKIDKYQIKFCNYKMNNKNKKNN